ncbi:MAG: efflux RND transporter permease subunit [Desulfarculus sp.]|nr:efflux RND transporter permease subunit [Desulfarculus sp.]
MSISGIFIRRPVMTSLIWLGVMIFGIMAYRQLPASDLPSVDFPTVQVTATLPGASPETMASAVATPLEREFSTIAGVDSINSQSATGITNITLQFSLDRTIDAASQDVQAAITRASSKLPQNMPTPPFFRKVNPADMPILYLALSSPLLPLSAINEYADTFMGQRISMISGVAQVMLYGAQKYAVRVQLDPKALASRGLGLDEVAGAVAKANVNLPTGTLQGPHQAFTVQATGQLNDAAGYRPVIAAYRQGNPVRLSELGRVIDSVENDKLASWYNNTRAVVLAIQRQPGTNTIEVVDAIKKLLPHFEAQLPASVKINILYDRSQSIRSSLEDVKFTLMLSIALVVLVVFLFLRNLSATAITSLALPASIVGTFAAMSLMGFSLDNLSLLALTLSVGFVVDDAIVMLENIVRHLEKGAGVMEAAFQGAKEIGFTVLSMTLSLVAVFIPVLFMGGILGRLLHEFAVVIGLAILISGFVSLSLTPMLCSRFLRPPSHQEHGRLYQASERVFEAWLRAYDWALTRVLGHRRLTMLVLLALTGGTLYLFTAMPTGFIPDEDQGQIFCFTEATQGISYDSMVSHQLALASIVSQDPNVTDFMSSVGVSGPNLTGNTGRMFMHLKERPERKLHVNEVINGLRAKMAQVPGIQAFLQNPPVIRIGGTLTKSLYQLTLQSPEMDLLYQAAPQLEAKMRELPILRDVTSDLQIKNPQVTVRIDRDKASALGISSQQVEDALYYAYGTRQVSTIYAPNNQYQVILELLPEYQRDQDSLSMLYVRSTSGELVPLQSVCKITRDTGPLVVNHAGQLPAVTISFNLTPGASLGEAVSKVQRLAAHTLPAGITMGFQGVAQAFQSSLAGMTLLLIMSILVIYLVLGVLYESYIHPVTILSGLPTAAFGALFTLMLFGMELNLYAFVGVIMLVGIMKKNAIMMIDFAIVAQAEGGKTPQEAIHEGCLVRFRPIMMTTMAALMGTLPIALGLGAGAESRRPLGLAVVGGLLVSQMLTLFVTPVFYTYMESFQERLRAWRARRRQARRPEQNQTSQG